MLHFKLKIHQKIVCRLGFALTHWGAYSTLLDPLAKLRGKEMERNGRRGGRRGEG